MEALQYTKMDIAANGNFELPEFFFVDGVLDFDKGLDELELQGYIHSDPDSDKFVYANALQEDYPEVYRVLYTIHLYDIQEQLDDLVERGYVELVYDQNDNEVGYILTELGAEDLAQH